MFTVREARLVASRWQTAFFYLQELIRSLYKEQIRWIVWKPEQIRWIVWNPEQIRWIVWNPEQIRWIVWKPEQIRCYTFQ